MHVSFNEMEGLLSIDAIHIYAWLRKTRLNPLVRFAIHVFHGRFVRFIVTLPVPPVKSLRPPMATAFELTKGTTLGILYVLPHQPHEGRGNLLG
jgi:hypothetical protein